MPTAGPALGVLSPEMRSTEETLDAPDATETNAGDPSLDATVASAPHRAPGEAMPIDRGMLVGRYVVLAKLGAGAMGVVFAAYDPELDRKVALKLLKTRANESDARARLQREAQALAKLNHGNVVAVHDVGVHDGRVFVAMEFVEGQTLGDWTKAEPRSWRDVVKVFEEAGRGLAAAHAAGLVHRDFKPDNVMIGVDGRVRVMDFGLARAGADEADSAISSQGPGDVLLTRTGAMVGTPAYMAPEQFAGGEVTARSDQFGFCVALFEALHGQRPFPGDSIAQLALAVMEGKIREPSRARMVPMWLRALVRRGLSSEPAQRFPDMPGLLAALGAGEARRRRIRVLAGVGVLALAAAGVLLWRDFDEQRRVEACIASGDTIDEIWNDDAREQLRAGLLATKLAYAPSTADKIMPWLDGQAQALREAQTEACLDTRVRETWSEDLLDRSMWCLDERRMEFEALVTLFTNADPEAVPQAVNAAARLARVDPCRDEHFLRQSPMPPQDRDKVQAVRATLANVAAFSAAGKYTDALALARAGLAEAEAVAWPALTADARVLVGSALSDTGELAAAEAELETAFFDATSVGATEVAALAAMQLVHVVGYKQARHDEGLRWGRHSEVALTLLGEPADGLRRALFLNRLSAVHLSSGGHEQLKALNERALAIYEVLGPNHPDIARTLTLLANGHHMTGDYARAIPLQERAVAIYEEALGPEHPYLAMALGNLAAGYLESGQYERTYALAERALAIDEAAHGPEHPDVAIDLSNLALACERLGDFERAAELHERALAVREKVLPPDHPDLATSLDSVGNVLAKQGEYERAKALQERALAMREKAFGTEHPQVALSLTNLARTMVYMGAHEDAKVFYQRAVAVYENDLGPEHPHLVPELASLADVHYRTGSYEEARQLYERSLAIGEQALGPEHLDLADPLLGLARLARHEGKHADAIALAERSVALRSSATVAPHLLAATRFVLAMALWEAPPEAGQDRPRARQLAEQSRTGYEGVKTKAGELAEVEKWLAEHTE
jgi:tetratricopeptide (TPR) repeat protein/predicted Ser/Thr protein kinase